MKRAKQSRLLKGSQDWQMLADLAKALHFSCHIVITTVRPDIVIWSDSRKCVHLVELTVPWEGNFDFANERKRTRYEPLRASCEDHGWACSVIAVEVGCRGFIARSTRSFVSNIGLPVASAAGGARNCSPVASRRNYHSSWSTADEGDAWQLAVKASV